MSRTSTLKAAAAALGLLAGFVMAPEAQGPLEREVTPYSVAVVWKMSAPPRLPSASGARMDDSDIRPAAAPAPRPAAPKARVPARAPAAKPQPANGPSMAEEPAPRVLHGAELAAATFGVPRRACPRDEVHHAHGLHGTSES
jgi:hypothetical protein